MTPSQIKVGMRFRMTRTGQVFLVRFIESLFAHGTLYSGRDLKHEDRKTLLLTDLARSGAWVVI